MNLGSFAFARRVLVAASVSAALLVTTGRCLAFKEAGHRAIEAAAYRDLLDETKTPDGQEVIQTLIAYGVLSPPAQPKADPSQLLDPDYASYTVDSLLVASHFPDHLFDRQLQADRQCFHFNASGGNYKVTDEVLPGTAIPLGLVQDAYLECIGLADALLRGVLFDPKASHEQGNGAYTLMHMVEDSYADSHVARDEDWKILYVKPWNLRTWPRYFFNNKHEAPIYSHFSAEHHMGSDTRDLGYLIGPTDEDYDTKLNDAEYQQTLRRCVDEGSKLIRRHRKVDYKDYPITILDMQGELVVPEVCLSRRAQRAKDAVKALLVMLAKLAPVVSGVRSENGEVVDPDRTGIRIARSADNSVSLDAEWLAFRRLYLAHYDPYLTDHMAPHRTGDSAPPTETRRDTVSSSAAFAPRKFHESGLGLTTELRSGTPLWLGLEEFVSRKTSSHNRPVLLLDTLGWGVQVRLPIENEMGENPVGVAFDVGIGLPLPLSELIGLDELQIFAGARGRLTYTAQSVFREETRHTIEMGFGGISLDFIVGNTAWFGLDAPRAMYQYDFWSKHYGWQSTYWSFSGGLAIDAF